MDEEQVVMEVLELFRSMDSTMKRIADALEGPEVETRVWDEDGRVPDFIPVDRAGRRMVDDDGNPIAVEDREDD